MTKKVIVSAVGTLVVIMIALGGYSLIFKKNKGENALPITASDPLAMKLAGAEKHIEQLYHFIRVKL